MFTGIPCVPAHELQSAVAEAAGRCVGAKWAKKVPAKAAVFAFPACEKWGLIWAFNGEKALWSLPDIDVPNEQLFFKHQRIPINGCDPFMFTANAFEFQHFGALHDLWPGDEVEEADVNIRWGQYDRKYSYGGKNTGWARIFSNVSVFWVRISTCRTALIRANTMPT